ncbi:hypothetical protein FFK22_028490 [Mycobacterium sp. KBS0706]|uniref:hypothetical protein n=1 Tax=Mycobacterium sp. KBS0706 TaxID=2578109 RepID=UPI00110FF70C|nr:hypothetical protein [Mycobacterium sp. KBS0706]TSD85255.1 hypothetical protein FFK22_028490 [Mycobacterium sp. KBS0706]
MPTRISPYERRLEASRARLRDALDRLVQGRPIHPRHQDGYRLTVAVLAREAGVGRNAIYTNHREMLDRLQAAAVAPKPPISWQDKLDELRATIKTMKQDERRMISENALLLQRARSAEAEAERYRRLHARLVAERDAALRAVPITATARKTATRD